MKLIAPKGYTDFACIAGACRHTCCKGWEIDIDDASMARYRACTGALGDALCQAIDTDEEGQHFHLLGEEERCPMLMENGLCRLICEAGEDALCQICTDHPRFRHFMGDRIEIGLGLCCEEAAREQLGREEPFCLTTLEDDGANEAPDLEEQGFYRWRQGLLQMAANRSQTMTERASSLAECVGGQMIENMAAWADDLLSLEILSEDWRNLLMRMKNHHSDDAAYDRLPIPSEQLLCALLYRHMADALEDGEAAGHVMVSLFLWQLCMTLAAVTHAETAEELADIARMMSSELEYSQENLDELLVWMTDGESVENAP